MSHKYQETAYSRMRSSLGFHTFTIFLKLTELEAIQLYKTFKECNFVRVRPRASDEKNKNTMPKGYFVEYLDRCVGISWYIRFNSEVAEYSQMSENPISKNFKKVPTPYSVRATINPKILNGTKDYLSAANADSLDKAEENWLFADGCG